MTEREKQLTSKEVIERNIQSIVNLVIPITKYNIQNRADDEYYNSKKLFGFFVWREYASDKKLEPPNISTMPMKEAIEYYKNLALSAYLMQNGLLKQIETYLNLLENEDLAYQKYLMSLIVYPLSSISYLPFVLLESLQLHSEDFIPLQNINIYKLDEVRTEISKLQDNCITHNINLNKAFSKEEQIILKLKR